MRDCALVPQVCDEEPLMRQGSLSGPQPQVPLQPDQPLRTRRHKASHLCSEQATPGIETARVCLWGQTPVVSLMLRLISLLCFPLPRRILHNGGGSDRPTPLGSRASRPRPLRAPSLRTKANQGKRRLLSSSGQQQPSRGGVGSAVPLCRGSSGPTRCWMRSWRIPSSRKP
jgi:hypothetical protein